MKLGIIGGTFNPIHFGHLRIAEEARDFLNLDRVIFVPALVPPHKEVCGNISFHVRYEMLELAMKDNPSFALSDIETTLDSPSFTVNLLDALNKHYSSAKLYFIIGSDSWQEIVLWHNYKEIFTKTSIAVLFRPGFSMESPLKNLHEEVISEFRMSGSGRYQHNTGHYVVFFRGEPLEISSSRMREISEAGGSLKYLTPDPVVEYIKSKRIYQNG